MTDKYFYSFLFQCFLHLDVSLDQYGGLFLLIIWEDTSEKKTPRKGNLNEMVPVWGFNCWEKRFTDQKPSLQLSCSAIYRLLLRKKCSRNVLFLCFQIFLCFFFVFPFTSLAGPLSCLGNHNRIQRCYQRSVPRFLFIISPQITPQAHKDNFKLVPP